MIVALVRFVSRVLVEFGLLLIFAGAIALLLAFRGARRLVTTEPDDLEAYSAPLVRILEGVAQIVALQKTRN